MKKQDKELLLKDLCARLPYGVEVKSSARKKSITLSLDVMVDFYLGYSVKPYLRPISSITDEEIKELVKAQILSKYGKEGNYVGLNNIKSVGNPRFSSLHNEWFCYVTFNSIDGEYTTCFSIGRVTWETTIAEIDLLNEHHIDYRGLISKDLALPAPEGIYDFK